MVRITRIEPSGNSEGRRRKVAAYCRVSTDSDLLSDSGYEAKIIDEEVYARFSDDLKQNYVYHEWDSNYGEYYYLYEIIPRVEKMMNAEELRMNQVRLLCRIC